MLSRFFEQLKAFYLGLDALRRRILIGGVTLAVLAITMTAWWASTETWTPLLSNATVEQVRRAAGALETEEVPYRISRDGSSISVPDTQLGQAWVLAASVDVLPGLGDVAAMPKVLTPGQQRWAFNRAREGDIAQMINQIDTVSGSRVTIVPRQEGTYFGEDRPATASVLIRLQPGSSLTQQQIRGITNLVANAVDGLNREGVTLIDDEGNMLASGQDGDDVFGSGGSASMLEYRTGIEKRTMNAVTNALRPVLGYGSDFTVSATVELDMISKETVVKTIDIESQAVISEQVDESTSQNSVAGGVPGVDANLPERESASSDRAEDSSSLGSTFNYAYPTTEEISRSIGGDVSRLSVAVQINSDTIAALMAADETLEEEALKDQIVETVKAAVGFDEERHDQVVVNFLPFVTPEMVEAVGGMGISRGEWLRYGLGLVGLVLFFLFVVRPIMERLPEVKKAKKASVKSTKADARAEEEEEGEENLASRLRNLVDNYQAVTADDLNQLVEREAEAAAQVIRLWTRHG